MRCNTNRRARHHRKINFRAWVKSLRRRRVRWRGKKAIDINNEDLQEIGITQIQRQEKIRHLKLEIKRIDHIAYALREQEELCLDDQAAKQEAKDREFLDMAEKEALKEKDLLIGFQPWKDAWVSEQMLVRDSIYREQTEERHRRCEEQVIKNKINRAKAEMQKYFDELSNCCDERIAASLVQLTDKAWLVRKKGLEVLAQVAVKGNRQTADSVASLLWDTEPAVQKVAYSTLSQIAEKGDQKTISILLERMSTGSLGIKIMVCSALGKIARKHDRPVVEVLVHCLGKTLTVLQKAALKALIEISGSWLLGLFKDFESICQPGHLCGLIEHIGVDELVEVVQRDELHAVSSLTPLLASNNQALRLCAAKASVRLLGIQSQVAEAFKEIVLDEQSLPWHTPAAEHYEKYVDLTKTMFFNDAVLHDIICFLDPRQYPTLWEGWLTIR